MRTSRANAAKAPRSPGSEVNTMPPGSAAATTRASTADPFFAQVRSQPARRVSPTSITSNTSQDLSKRFTRASLPAWPCKHSTNTGDGTTGGQRPSRMNFSTRSAARGTLRNRNEMPPESTTRATQLAACSEGRNAWSTISLAQASSSGVDGPTSARSISKYSSPALISSRRRSSSRTAFCNISEAGKPCSLTAACRSSGK